MSDLSNSWKKTAKSMLIAANDLGCSLIESVKAGYDATMEWARSDNDDCVQTEATEVPDVEEAAPAEEESSKAE